MGWNQITVKQYIELRPINKRLADLEALPKTEDSAYDIMEQKCVKLAHMFGKPVEYFQKLSFAKLETSYKMALQIEAEATQHVPKFEITLNGTKYKCISNPSELNTSGYLALQVFRKDTLANMAKVLSWLYRPVEGEHDPDKAESDFLQAKINDVSGCFFLFFRRWSKWKVATIALNQTLMEELKDTIPQVLEWSKSTDGITHLAELSQQRQ